MVFLLLLILFSIQLFAQIEKPDIKFISLDSLLALPVQSASKFTQNIADAPASVSIITFEEIENFGYKSLGDVLQFVKSFYITNDLNYIYSGVRAFGRPTDYNNRILLLINGHKLNESVYGSALIGNELGLDLSSIDRIEIVRGPGSVLYGTNAMFAVINIVTKKAAQVDGINTAIEYGSYQHKKVSINFGKIYDNKLNIYISGNIMDSKGDNIYFEEFDSGGSENGIAYNLNKERYHSVFSSVKYLDFTLQSYYSNRWKSVPTAPYSTVFNHELNTKDDIGFLELSYFSKLSNTLDMLIKGYYDYYFYEGYYPYSEDDEILILKDQSIGQTLGGEVQTIWQALMNNRIVAGIEFRQSLKATYSSWYDAVNSIDGNYPYSSIASYFNNEYKPFSNLAFILGLRAEKYSNMDFNITPRLGLVYNLGLTSLKFLYGFAYRTPNVYEVNYFDDISGHKVSQGLKNEKIITTEFIVENKFNNSIFTSLSLFHNTVNNLIDTGIDETDSLINFLNLNNARAYGAEFSIQLYPGKSFRNYINYTFQKSYDLENGTNLSNIPTQIFNAGAVYNLLSTVIFSMEIHYETGRKTVYDTFTSPFFLTNMNVVLNPFNENLSFALKINNLFDRKYKLPGGFEHIQNAIPQSGRIFILKADYTF